MKKNSLNTKLITGLSLVTMFILITACEEFIEVGPPKTEIVTETVFTSDGSATSAISGIYSLMMTNQSFTRAGIEEFTGLLSDEFRNYATNADQIQFFNNELTDRNVYVQALFWREPYRYINNANAVLEGLKQSTGVSQLTRNQLEGEAYFIRAFCHFYLVALFGDVPYLTSTDYRVNIELPRTNRDRVFERIEEDLLKAKELMVSDFSFANNERVRPNRGAATALLARVYLYMSAWDKAELQATELISNSTTYELEELSDVFGKASREAIWQLKPVVPQANTQQAQVFVLTGPPNATSKRVTLTTGLHGAFEAGDNRLTAWVGQFSQAANTWYFSAKYKRLSTPSPEEYSIVFRLAEQYLIRAEARSRQEKFLEAQKTSMWSGIVLASTLRQPMTNKRYSLPLNTNAVSNCLLNGDIDGLI